MLESFQNFFRELAETHPKWNFIYFYDPVQFARVMEGLYYTLYLSVVCVVLSVIIGVVGAWAQGSPYKPLRLFVQGLHPVLPQHAAPGAAAVLLLRARPVHPHLLARRLARSADHFQCRLGHPVAVLLRRRVQRRDIPRRHRGRAGLHQGGRRCAGL
jgi:hypothetical protein